MKFSDQVLDLQLLPQPRSFTRQPGFFAVSAAGSIGIADSQFYAIAREVQCLFPTLAIHASYAESVDTLAVTQCGSLHRDGYRLRIGADGIGIVAGAVSGAFYAVQTLRQIVEQASADGLPCLEIEDWPDFQDRGLYYDVTRGRVPKLERLLELADQLSRYKINQLQLYIEHTFAFRGHPDIGRDASPLSAEDILKLDAYCRARHIELVPSLASFGHLSTVLKHPQYHHLAEDLGIGHFVDPDAPKDFALHAWTLSPANPQSYAFLDSLFAEFLPLFSSKRFNACCDEVYDLGWGESYELCRQRGKGRVYLDHIIRVGELAAKYGKQLMFWGDIIRHHPELVPEIPKDVTVLDWAYSHSHAFDSIVDFQRAGLEFFACPGTNSWISLFPRLPVACGNIAGFAAAARGAGARGLLNTDWGDGGHYNFMEYSWHGYLFGAEQAWNSGADRTSFTHRFVARFLRHDDAELAAGLDELGEIASLSPGGGNANSSLWTEIFFALPGDAVFSAPPAAGLMAVRDGRVVTEPRQVNAELGREMAARLMRIRAVLAARAADQQQQQARDPLRVLPYWVFAADTLIIAARRLTAFAPDGHVSADERAALDNEFAALRQRFTRLWRARNRPSQIGIALARYDRVIRGQNVVAKLTQSEPGRLCLSVTNAGTRTAAASVTLTAAPHDAVRFADAPAQLIYSRLRPGATCTAEFAFAVMKHDVPLKFRATATAAGFVESALTIYPECNWPISQLLTPEQLSLSALPALLAPTAPRQALLCDEPVAEVRLALAGDALAVVAKVYDVAVRRGEPVWRGSCLELFACAGVGEPIGQVLLTPPVEHMPAAAFRLSGGIIPAPEIKLAAVEVGPDSYTLAALVPLCLLALNPGVEQFRFDAVATACTAGRSEHRRASLFFASENAFRDSNGFGCLHLRTEQ